MREPSPQLLLDAPKPKPVTVLVAPHPLLRMISRTVTEFGEDLYQLVSNLATAMYSCGAIGLSAPQVKVLQRVFVVDLYSPPRVVNGNRLPHASGELLVAVNPEIVWSSDETEVGEEGCLSLPGARARVARPTRVKVRAQDHLGEWWEAEWGDMLGRAVQHEIDHLHGMLMSDHLKNRDREVFETRYAKVLSRRPLLKERGGLAVGRGGSRR
jgi:peptide deformylase